MSDKPYTEWFEESSTMDERMWDALRKRFAERMRDVDANFEVHSTPYSRKTWMPGEWTTGPAEPGTNEPNKADEETDEMIMPFGKHKGQPITQVPTDYLEWAKKQEAGSFYAGFPAALDAELKRRKDAEAEFEAEEDFQEEGTEPPFERTWGSVNSQGQPRKDRFEPDRGNGPSNTRTTACAYCTDGVVQPASPRGLITPVTIYCSRCELGRLKETNRILKDRVAQAETAPKLCRNCDNGIRPNFPSWNRFCDCALGHLARQKDQLANESREYQRRMLEAERRAATASSRMYDDFSDMTPRRTAGAKKSVAVLVIKQMRQTAAAKYHPDRNRAADASVQLANINNVCDFFEKCSEKLKD